MRINFSELNFEDINFTEFKPHVVNENGELYSFTLDENSTTSYDVVVNKETVIVHNIEHKTGFSKSGKPWHRWEKKATRIYSLKATKNGYPILRIYSAIQLYRRRGRFLQNVTTHEHLRQMDKMFDLTNFLKGKVWTAFSTDYYSAPDEPVKVGSFTQRPRYMMGHSVEPLAQLFAVWQVIQKYKEKDKNSPQPLDWGKIQFQNYAHFMAYPALRMFQGTEFPYMLWIRLGHIWLNEPELKPFIKKVYGKAAVRKDFIKTFVESQSVVRMSVCHVVRGLVPVDWMISFLKKEASSLDTLNERGQYFTLRTFFKKISVNDRKRLLLEDYRSIYVSRYRSGSAEVARIEYGKFVQDALRMLGLLTPEQFEKYKNDLSLRNWKELHDTLSRVQHRIGMESQPVPQEGLTKRLDGVTYQFNNEKYKVVSPKMNVELIEWGGTLNNCIASYSKSVVSRQTEVFAVYKADKTLYANLEVRQGSLIQFVEKFNHPVPPEMWKIMETMVRKANQKPRQKKKITS